MIILKSCVQAEKKGRPEGSMLSAFIIEKAVLEIEKVTLLVCNLHSISSACMICTVVMK